LKLELRASLGGSQDGEHLDLIAGTVICLFRVSGGYRNAVIVK
jgi:hypothetical protein